MTCNELLGVICAHLLHADRHVCLPCLTFQLTLRPEQTVLPLVDKSNTVETRRGVTFQHPEILAHADLVTATVSEPYYWRLPEQFRGSMVGKPPTPTGCILNVASLLKKSVSFHIFRPQITAYGGQLKYAVYYEARDETGPSSYEPQVIIKGGPNHNILMTHHIPGIQLGQLTRHEIDMTEVAKHLPSELFEK